MTIQQAFQLALQHHRAGQLSEAEAIYRRILAADPRQADAFHLLGLVAHAVGRFDVALNLIHRAIEVNGVSHEYYGSLGVVLADAGQLEKACAAYTTAIRLGPRVANTYNDLGIVLARQGHFEQAVAAIQSALRLNPDLPEGFNNLGNALRGQGRWEEAVAAYRMAIDRDPKDTNARNNLGVILTEHGHFEEAIAACRAALAVKHDSAEAHYNLGNALIYSGKLDDAVTSYRTAIQIRPSMPEAHNNLGNALKDQGRFDEAVASHRKAIQLRPEFAFVFRSSLLLTLHHHPGCSVQAIAEEQSRWSHDYAEPLSRSIQPHGNDRDPERRLRIGFVSPDFREHSVAFFIAPLLEELDRRQVEVICYSTVKWRDSITELFMHRSDLWRDVALNSDEELVRQVRTDGVDILVDLSMHSNGNRLLAFARRPAPVQVSWLAYPGAAGLRTIDYRITDSYLEPHGAEESDFERPVRLPVTWCCYDPLGLTTKIGELPAVKNGWVTFGSLHNFCKANDAVLHCWGRVLEAVPDSRLLLYCPEGWTRGRVLSLLAEYGVVEGRVEFVSHCALFQYLELHNRIDVMLDTWPCNGMTVTCHSLWMGVPVITLPGVRPVSRAGLSLMKAVGLPEFIAKSEDDYVDIATRVASDFPRLAALRGGLRQRMQGSPLMDGPRFARNLEAAFREMWRGWCERGRERAACTREIS